MNTSSHQSLTENDWTPQKSGRGLWGAILSSWMTLDIETIANSSIGVGLLSTLAGIISPRLGHLMADAVARQIVRQRDSRLVRAVRANQWVVLGERVSCAALDRAVHETLRQSARSVFDLYHFIHRPQAVANMIVMDAAAQQLIKRSEFEDRGAMVVGVHLSNFDLILRWLCRQGLRPMVLTVSDPKGGRWIEYEMRRQLGMGLVPASVAGLRRVLKHLQAGGAALSGIDRPVSQPRLQPRFFGRPTSLPVHHIFIATRARVPVVVVAAMREPDGKYHVVTSDPIEMTADHDENKQTLRNAEAVLHIAEGFIRRAPHQWAMPLPVWPSSLDLAPQ